MKRVQIKMQDNIYETMSSKAKALSLSNSEFVRSLIMEQTITKKLNQKDYTRTLGLLGNLTNNINQIAHNLNIARNDQNLDKIDYEDIINKLIILEALVEAHIKEK